MPARPSSWTRRLPPELAGSSRAAGRYARRGRIQNTPVVILTAIATAPSTTAAIQVIMPGRSRHAMPVTTNHSEAAVARYSMSEVLLHSSPNGEHTKNARARTAVTGVAILRTSSHSAAAVSRKQARPVEAQGEVGSNPCVHHQGRECLEQRELERCLERSTEDGELRPPEIDPLLVEQDCRVRGLRLAERVDLDQWLAEGQQPWQGRQSKNDGDQQPFPPVAPDPRGAPASRAARARRRSRAHRAGRAPVAAAGPPRSRQARHRRIARADTRLSTRITSSPARLVHWPPQDGCPPAPPTGPQEG